MGDNTKIEWCDHTFNPWIGCTKVSVGGLGACVNCYAEVATPTRAMHIKWGVGQPRHRTSSSTWALPLKWERSASAFQAMHGRRQRVFCASLADVFDNEVPAQWRLDLFRLIGATPNLDWLVLTKRIGNAWPMMLEVSRACRGGERPLDNVWLGATVANQEEADRDISKLLATPARVRFLSIEPMLGPIDLRAVWTHCPVHDYVGGFCVGPCADRRGISWTIVGGESGPKARRFDIGWARDILKQCKGAGVPAFVKQIGARPTWNGCAGPDEHWPPRTESVDNGNGYWDMRLRDRKGGDWEEWPADLRVREFPVAQP